MTYEHHDPLPQAIFKKLKPIYICLASREMSFNDVRVVPHKMPTRVLQWSRLELLPERKFFGADTGILGPDPCPTSRHRYRYFICIIAFVTAMQEQHITSAKQKQKQTNKQIINVKADDRGEFNKRKKAEHYQRVLLCVCVCLSFPKDRQKA